MSITDVKVDPPATRPSRRQATNQRAEAYLAQLDSLHDELEHYQNEESRLTDALNRERHARQVEAARADSEIKVLREQLAKAEYERDFFHTQAREFVVELRRMEETVGSIFTRVGRVSEIYERNAPNVVARLARMAEHEQKQRQAAAVAEEPEPRELEPNADQPVEPAPAAELPPAPEPFGAPGATGTVDDGAPPPSFLRPEPTEIK